LFYIKKSKQNLRTGGLLDLKKSQCFHYEHFLSHRLYFYFTRTTYRSINSTTPPDKPGLQSRGDMNYMQEQTYNQR